MTGAVSDFWYDLGMYEQSCHWVNHAKECGLALSGCKWGEALCNEPRNGCKGDYFRPNNFKIVSHSWVNRNQYCIRSVERELVWWRQLLFAGKMVKCLKTFVCFVVFNCCFWMNRRFKWLWCRVVVCVLARWCSDPAGIWRVWEYMYV